MQSGNSNRLLYRTHFKFKANIHLSHAEVFRLQLAKRCDDRHYRHHNRHNTDVRHHILSRQQNQRSMADKTVMLTLHNLDSAIDNMESLINEMQQHDSIYARAMSLMPDSIGIMGSDSLQMIINNFGSYRIHITDNSTKQIFSSSFEVWQYLDDAKVVGRIGNCYSILSSCDKEYNRIADLKQKRSNHT